MGYNQTGNKACTAAKPPAMISSAIFSDRGEVKIKRTSFNDFSGTGVVVNGSRKGTMAA